MIILCKIEIGAGTIDLAKALDSCGILSTAMDIIDVGQLIKDGK